MTEENVPADDQASTHGEQEGQEIPSPPQESTPAQPEPAQVDEHNTPDHLNAPSSSPSVGEAGPTAGQPGVINAGDHPQEQASPWPWTPQTQDFPSPEEDAALAQERAERFGALNDEPDHEASPQGTDTTQVFTPGEETQHLPTPPVTPMPAAPTQGHAPTAPLPPSSAEAGLGMDDDFQKLDDGPVSRAAAHWWTVLITLVFTPVAWYLLTDGGLRLNHSLSTNQPPDISTYVELGIGALALFIFLLAARWSSVGSIIIGSLCFVAGVAFLIFPAHGMDILNQSTQYFGRLGQFGTNVVQHLSLSFTQAFLAVYGLVLIMVGVVSHGARRQGRREERTAIALGE